MDRRSFLKNAGIGGAAAATAAAASFPTPALSQGKMELKMVTTWPKNLPGLGTGAQRFADTIGVMTDGRITVKLFAGGELVPPFESFDAVSQGTADIYHGAEYYWVGKHKAFAFFATVPLGMTCPEINAWIQHMGGQELWDELSAGFNIKPFQCGNTGVQMGGWFAKEINSTEDLKGLKFRMPGLGGEVLRRLGVNVVNLPGGEIFPALQSGAIDGTEWVGPWNDLAFGFYKVVKYYYWPGFHEPGPTLGMGINKGVWDKLSDSDKAIFAAAARAENDYMYSEFLANNGTALDTLVNEHGVILKEFSNEVFDAIGATAEEVVAEVGAEDDLGKRIYESYMKSRKAVSGWGRISEQAYTIARERILGS